MAADYTISQLYQKLHHLVLCRCDGSESNLRASPENPTIGPWYVDDKKLYHLCGCPGPFAKCEEEYLANNGGAMPSEGEYATNARLQVLVFDSHLVEGIQG